VALILVIVSLVGFGLTQRSTNRQEQALLQGDTNQAAAYASQVFSGLGTSISSAAAVVKSANGSPSAFEKSAGGGAASPLVSLLVKRTGSGYTVIAATGKGFHQGQVLDGPTLATVRSAGTQVIAGPVIFDGKSSTARFAVGLSKSPSDLVVYEQFTLKPFEATPVTAGKPFDQLVAALYGTGRLDIHHLLISTSRSIPHGGPVAKASVEVGSSHWTLVAAARQPLIGGFARSSPEILLVLGILMALLIGASVEILQRRQRYANELVEERTADLNRSLQDLKEAQTALVLGERLSAVGEMAMVVGHELRNPLAAVTNALFLIRGEMREPVSDMLARNLTMAERETRKAATLADDLTAFVRPREPEPMSIHIGDLIDEVLSATSPPSKIEVITDLEDFTFSADRGQMAEVITNLVNNAYQAMPDGGSLRIRAWLEHGSAALTVQDTGPGIDVAVADRVFEPFYTTKSSGTGLGLAIVHRLVSAHGGTIDVENVPTGGARFTVLLPEPAGVLTP
jgi:signal transduction histidine kinase